MSELIPAEARSKKFGMTRAAPRARAIESTAFETAAFLDRVSRSGRATRARDCGNADFERETVSAAARRNVTVKCI